MNLFLQLIFEDKIQYSEYDSAPVSGVRSELVQEAGAGHQVPAPASALHKHPPLAEHSRSDPEPGPGYNTTIHILVLKVY